MHIIDNKHSGEYIPTLGGKPQLSLCFKMFRNLFIVSANVKRIGNFALTCGRCNERKERCG